MRTLRLLLTGAGLATVALCQTVDGALDDSYWAGQVAHTLAPAQPATPVAGGEVKSGLCGGHLCISARLPEPGGRISARSFGRNPIWEKDAFESPSVEDRVEFELRLPNAARSVTIAVNPWGAYRTEEADKELSLKDLWVAARIDRDGWTTEAAIPLNELGLAERIPAVEPDLRVTRIRARRPRSPELRWSWAGSTGRRTPTALVPRFAPPTMGNTEPALEIGRAAALPDMSPYPADPVWRDVPAFELPRNEPYPRQPRWPTRVQWVHDGRTLALLVQAEEPEPVVARAGGRDSNVTGDDHVAIYLATSGSALLEIAVNTVGAVRDARARGPHAMRPETGWNAEIETRTEIRHGAWYARINLPLTELAAALGEPALPAEWRVVVARYRARRRGDPAESSALPPLGTPTFSGPLRYRRLVLRDTSPSDVAKVATPWTGMPERGLAAELAHLDPHAWSALERRRLGVTSLLESQQRKRAEAAVWSERQDWENVRTRDDWERFRNARMDALRRSLGQYPPQRPPLDVRVSRDLTGKGYRLQNLAFQSRPGYYVTANLYSPEKLSGRAPAIVIVHSQHYPKTQGELHDMGELWARTGNIVLVMERPGYGERAETSTWYRQAYASRFNFSKQLFLAGESYSGWAVWDIIRAVDMLEDRADVDRDRIILLGSVAGGGEPAGVAAALDPRIDAVAPFNYDQGHIRVHGDSPGQIAQQFSPWLVAASIAPRRFIRAFEFGWEGAEEHDYPSLWVDGLERSQKVWGFYDARDHLASIQAYGLIRLSMERVSHCFSIGPQQRAELHPLLQRWFRIPLPSREDLSILPDSQLSVNPYREEARRQEAIRRRPHADLLSITPELSAQMKRRSLHEVARETAAAQLAAARARKRLAAQLRDELAPLLGDIAPAAVRGDVKWTRPLSAATAEAVVLEVQGGIPVPLLLLRPKGHSRTPVVVAVAQGGKERFLANRANELERLLSSGVAVCLPDVRGTGETSPSPDRNRDGGVHHQLAEMEFDLAANLLGARLKDVRSVLAYLRTRSDIDTQQLAIWGDSFAPPNPPALYLDEAEFEVSPQIQHRSEPAGALLALLTALYEPELRAVAGRGGLSSYLSVLDSAYTYTPMDAIVLGILKVADVEDIAAAVAPRPLSYRAAVDGRNVAVPEASEADDVATWLAKQLK